MEIIETPGTPRNPKRENRPCRQSEERARNLFIGLLFVLAGGLWLLGNFELIPHALFKICFSWQMLLVVIGGYLIAVRRKSAGIITGCVGLFFLATDLMHISISFTKVILPLLLIVSGVSIILSIRKKKQP